MQFRRQQGLRSEASDLLRRGRSEGGHRGPSRADTECEHVEGEEESHRWTTYMVGSYIVIRAKPIAATPRMVSAM